MKAERKQFALLDVLKFVFIFIIMLSHTANEQAHLTGIWHYVLSLYNFGVPFCFACSGYLYFSKLQTLSETEQKDYYKKYSIRLGKMYLAWSIIYIAFTIVQWCIHGVTQEAVLARIHLWLVYTTYPTIWFVPALWVGVTMAFIIWKKWGWKLLFITASVFMVVGSAMGSYHNLLSAKWGGVIEYIYDGYIAAFYSFRNGVFNGFPFVVIGALIAKKQNTMSLRVNLCLAVFFAVGVMAECVMIKHFNYSAVTDLAFLIAPAIYYLLSWATKVEVKYNPAFLWMRNLSMIVFLSQRLFLTAIPSVSDVYSAWIGSMSQLQIMIVIPAMVMIFSWTVIVLTKRIPVLKVLW